MVPDNVSYPKKFPQSNCLCSSRELHIQIRNLKPNPEALIKGIFKS